MWNYQVVVRPFDIVLHKFFHSSRNFKHFTYHLCLWRHAYHSDDRFRLFNSLPLHDIIGSFDHKGYVKCLFSSKQSRRWEYIKGFVFTKKLLYKMIAELYGYWNSFSGDFFKFARSISHFISTNIFLRLHKNVMKILVVGFEKLLSYLCGYWNKLETKNCSYREHSGLAAKVIKRLSQ